MAEDLARAREARAKARARAREAQASPASSSPKRTPAGADELQGVNASLDLSLPPHKRLQLCAKNWLQLKDGYLAKIAQYGLLLDWVEGFDPEHPSPNFRPQWWESRKDLPDTVASIILGLAAAGSYQASPAPSGGLMLLNFCDPQ